MRNVRSPVVNDMDLVVKSGIISVYIYGIFCNAIKNLPLIDENDAGKN